ncbi:hypothetical protein GDO86_014348 [Hymenochirus boettgeri]|uniref:Src kinase-associated phosphoprotein 1 n=1 Tax=Hymenochirus boettgeri TaxID=247094 RepID=A0A8T2JSM7_9PIPI|nr:hypothetical protein GDO86_014348 [Hymenochirus boettgeri]
MVNVENTEETVKVLKQSYLEKRKRDHGFFGSEWQKRWCVLTKKSFLYYSSEKGKQPKGGFFIKNTVAQIVQNIRKDSRRDCCFEVVSSDQHIYQFTAGSPSDAKDWVEQIQFLVKDTLSTSIPWEDDEETYDDVDSIKSSPGVVRALPPDREGSAEEEDIYEVVPDQEEFEEFETINDNRYQTNTGITAINYRDYYQGLWDCLSDNSDELSFERGDLIHILSKEYNAYGWWVGELDGMVGIVPKDYLTLAFEI